jgi:acid phosphatase type 7
MASLNQPLFSSGRSGGSGATRPLVRLLYRAGAEIVVSGRDRLYERFAPAGPRGVIDTEHGIRHFIVGTGGAPLNEPGPGRPAHSEVRQGSSHGVLKRVLEADRFRWRFIAVRGTFDDRGVGSCHERPAAHVEPGRTVG